MGNSRTKRASLFDKGARAVERYLGHADLYVCPLCLRAFDKEAVCDGQLTIEHVPPKRLGGRGILLTCKQCNSFSGHALDAAVSQREEQRRFAETVLGNDVGYRGRATWIAKGKTLNVEVYRDGKFLTVAGIPKLNDKAVAEAMTMAGSMCSGVLTSRVRYSRRRAAVSDLRTAYLAAFALLGYRYALHPIFNVVREQIANPDEHNLVNWSVNLAPETPLRRRVHEISNPQHCLVVQVDRVGVFLPVPGRSNDLFDQLATEPCWEMNVRSLGWPSTMELREDFSETTFLPSIALEKFEDEFR